MKEKLKNYFSYELSKQGKIDKIVNLDLRPKAIDIFTKPVIRQDILNEDERPYFRRRGW